MIPLVSFPFGASAQSVSLSVSTLIDMSERAVPFIQAGNLSALADLLRQHRIPLLHQGDAVRQLAAGMGIAYPDRIDPAQVERAAPAVQAMADKSLEERNKYGMRIVAGSLVRELTSNGYAAGDVISVATEMLCLINDPSGTGTITKDQDQRSKAVRVLARSISRELFGNGFTDKDIVTLATSLLRLANRPR
jgi:hypothetical protein